MAKAKAQKAKKAKIPPRHLTLPRGFYAAGTTCGIKASGLPDLALIAADRPCAAAGVFTRSRTPGAPLIVSRRHLGTGRASAIIINSGNANASTGQAGLRDAREMCRLVAQNLAHCPHQPLQQLKLSPRDVLVASTGIIGRPLPMDRIARGVATLTTRLGRGRTFDAQAARAILTTDLAPKAAHRQITLAGKTVHLAGIAKGSGMIAPNMATMLAFITTDAAIAPAMLRQALRQAAQASFNRISVDQHTSPSDMAIILASGAANHPTLTQPNRNWQAFCDALTDLCRDLAYQIVKDGEGATKVFRVQVTGARTQRDADRVAQAIVNSPLVKTAVHGGDPNWGRITTAAGYSGAAVNPANMSLTIGGSDGLCVYQKGAPLPLNKTQERRLHAIMRKKEITFTLNLGQGRASTEWLGCDLSRQYIAINADYTT
ncbi:MAG TPA: bifunctional glutamate N-acetyltransferase/amino-acid acetyltransferase ArgJ [Phycisphaeraceae bacterium]